MITAGRHPVLVVGDSMLDRYWEGCVERISPEAPVPVLRVTREFNRAGGAANVAINAAALGADTSLLTLIGQDDVGDALRALLERQGVTVRAIGDSRHRTTYKIRHVARRHQLLRTDFEQSASMQCSDELCDAFADLLQDGAVVVLSDYAKGALRRCADLIAIARERGCMVLVDPKGSDCACYRGADVLKPNATELREIVGSWGDEREFQHKCFALRESLGIGALLVTLGEDGMTLFDEAGAHRYASRVRDVFDVSGAGDTVIATLACKLAENCTLTEATAWANHAAGIAVSKFGTASVSPDELDAAVRPGRDAPGGEVWPGAADGLNQPAPVNAVQHAGRLQ